MPTSRFKLLMYLMLLLLVGVALQSAAAPEVEPLVIQEATPNKPITLRDRLIVGLQARIPFEIAFCDRIVEKVQTGQLPERIVNETFFWARQRAQSARNDHNYRPITYFIPAMRARAERLHIVLDSPVTTTNENTSFIDSLFQRTFFPFR